MRLKEMLKVLPEAKLIGTAETSIRRIQFDSRKLQPGDLFVAISGFKVDGHRFVPEAVKKQAAALVLERDQSAPSQIAKIIVPDSRKALAHLSSLYYDYPATKLKMIGITGTNGKTSVGYLVHNILENLNLKCGIIGTVEKKIGSKHYHDPNTTPESLILQEILADMVIDEAKAAVMEVSSHALELYRVEDCSFDVATFTNLTHDHLDFHRNMDNYYRSKKKLFEKLKEPGWGIINWDDSYGRRLVKELPQSFNCLTYGLGDQAKVRAVNYEVQKGIKFDVFTPFGNSRIAAPNLIGIYNLYNLLAAIATTLALGFKLEEIRRALSQFERIPGRFQRVRQGQDFEIIIDYAHTPDGVQKVLQVARSLQQGKGRIIVVMGCAGERDPLKRPIMGKIAAELSDLLVITEQDSRSENPQKIISDVYRGARGFGNIKVVENRIEAINYALSVARKGDMVLILGKGHEKTLYLNRATDYKGDYLAVEDCLSSSFPFTTS